MTPSAWLSRVAVSVVILALAGCADDDRQSLRDCAEASALERTLLRESYELEGQDDPKGRHLYRKNVETLSATTRWKESVCPKVEETTDER
jgi:hypothetical protein